jgi:glycosyltransferase involved in cell wall biosynthesis
VIWPEFRPRRPVWRLLGRLLRGAYRRTFAAVLSTSRYVTRQVESIAVRDVCPIVEFVPTFRREAFSVPPPAPERRPFRVMFVGRFEAYKGLFTLVEVARRLKQLGRKDIVFDLCGDGGVFNQIKDAVQREGLGDSFVLHGWCSADKLQEVSKQSHVYVVPTTTEFVEGFNHVIIEGLLVGRPVVTSKVCPAVEYVPNCLSLGEPDSAEGYLAAILALADDVALYKRLQERCLAEAARFLDPSEESFGAAARHVLLALREGRAPERRMIPLRPAPRG